MRFFIVLAVLSLAAAYPSDNSGFVDVEAPMTMEASESEEVEAIPEEKMPENVEDAAGEPDGSKDESSEDDEGAEDEPQGDDIPEEPTSGKCTKEGNVLDEETCGFIMCSPAFGGGFSEYRQPCPHLTCFSEETNQCEWKRA